MRGGIAFAAPDQASAVGWRWDVSPFPPGRGTPNLEPVLRIAPIPPAAAGVVKHALANFARLGLAMVAHAGNRVRNSHLGVTCPLGHCDGYSGPIDSPWG